MQMGKKVAEAEEQIKKLQEELAVQAKTASMSQEALVIENNCIKGDMQVCDAYIQNARCSAHALLSCLQGIEALLNF